MSNKPDNTKLASLYENMNQPSVSGDDRFAEAFELALDEMGDQALKNITNAYMSLRNPAKALHALYEMVLSENAYRNQPFADADEDNEDMTAKAKAKKARARKAKTAAELNRASDKKQVDSNRDIIAHGGPGMISSKDYYTR